LALLLAFNFSTFSQSVPRSGLVAWYPFNGNANDESGNGNNGTNNGGVLTQDRNSKNNSAYYFSGVSCSPHVAATVNTSSVNSSGDVTIALWVLRKGNGCGGPRFLQFGTGENEFNSSGGHFVMGWANGESKIFIEHSSARIQHRDYVWGNDLSDDTWYHITYTYNGSQAKLYINGTLVNTRSISGTAKLDQSLSVGRFNKPAYDAFNGNIDELGVWNRILTDAEIRSLVLPGPEISKLEARNQAIDLTWTLPGDNAIKKYKIYRSTSSIPSIKLEWDAIAGTGNKYQIFRGTSPIVSNRSLLIDALTETSYTDEGITNSSAYYYWIRSINSTNAYSEYSDVYTMSAIPYVNADSSTDGYMVFKFNTISATDVTKIYVYKGTSTSPVIKYDSISVTSRYVDSTNILFDQDVYYRFTSGGPTLNESNYSNEIKTIAYSIPNLVNPSNNQTKTDTSLTFRWNKINNATGYKLQYTLDKDFLSSNVTEVSATDSFYVQTGLKQDTTYYWRVKVVSGVKTSNWSTKFKFFTYVRKPALTTISTTDKKINIAWAHNSIWNVKSFKIFRGTSDNPTQLLDSISSSNLTYTDNVENGIRYYYRIKTVNTDNVESEYSNQLFANSFNKTSLESPSNNAVKEQLKPTFKWSAIDNTTKYNIQISKDSTFASITELDTTISKTELLYQKSLTQNTFYYWRLRNGDDYGFSNWTNKFVLQTYIDAPIISTIKPGNKVDSLTWSVTSTANLQKIKIYRDTVSVPLKLLDSVSGNILSYIDTIGLKINTKYYYRLVAVNNQNVESDFSLEGNSIPFNKYPIAVKLSNKSFSKVDEYNTIRTTYSFIGSTDPDGKIISFKWYVNDQLINSTDTILIHYYYQGTNTIKLLVEDNDGYKDSSIALVVLKSFEKKFNGGILGGITALSPNIIYAADSSYDPVNGASIYKLDRSGNTNFALAVTSKIFTTPSVSQDSSVFITSGSNLNGFNKSGAPLWPTIPLGGLSQVTPTVDSMNNRIYVGVANKNFFAIDYKTGKVIWNFQCDAPINASAVITGDRKLVFVSQNGTLYGFDIRGDSVLTKATWQYALGETIAKSAAVDDSSNLYFGTVGGKLIKLKLNRDGSVTKYWTRDLSAAIETSPVIDANGYVYIGTKTGKFVKTNPSTGEVIWEYTTTGSIKSTPALTDFGTIVLATTNGQIVALDTSKSVKWVHKEESPISANLLYIQNMVYIGTEAGNLIALYDNPNTNTVNTSLSKVEKNKMGSIHGSLANANENLTFIDLGLAKQKNLSTAFETIEPKNPVWGTFQGNYRRTGSKPLECPAKPTLNKSGTITICNGENVELTTSAIGNSSWVIDGQETTDAETKLLATKAGVYKRIAKNENGCKIYSEEVTIKVNESPTKPIAVASSKTTFCEGESVQLNSSSSINNSWYRVGQSAVKGTLQGLTVDSTGSYYAKVTLSNGCTSNSDTIKVTVNAKPELPVISSASTEICSGDSLSLNVKTGFNNQWYFNGVTIKNATSEKYTARNAGVYSVKITNTNGCSNTSEALELIVKPTTEIPSIIPSGLPSICQGSTLLLTSSVNANNVWYKNGVKVGTGQFLNVTDSGFYKVTAMRTNMCMSQSDSLKVTVNKAPSIPIITRNQTELVSNYTSGNQWYSSDGSAIPGASEQKFRPALSGYYTVRATVDGCTTANSAVYYYLSTAVVNFGNNQYLKLYPNPVQSNLFIEYNMNTAQYVNIRMMDMQGRTVKEYRKVRTGDKLNMSGLSKGAYMLLITTNDGKILFNQKMAKD